MSALEALATLHVGALATREKMQMGAIVGPVEDVYGHHRDRLEDVNGPRRPF